jgi:hypothetical protein
LVIAALSALALVVRHVRNGWAGAIFFAASVAVGPLALRALITPNYHTTTVINVALLGAVLPLLSSGTVGYAPRAAVALPIALLTGLNVASDPLLWVVGVLPFALAIGYGAVRFPNVRVPLLVVAVAAIWTVAAVALPIALLTGLDVASTPLLWVVSVVSFVVALVYGAVRFRNIRLPILIVAVATIWAIVAVDKLVRDAMVARDVSIIQQPVALTSLGHLPHNFLNLADAVALVFGADLVGTGIEGSKSRNVVLAALVLVVFAAIAVLLARELWARRGTRRGGAEEVLVVYAGGTILAISSAFALTTIGETSGPGNAYYFLSFVVAIPLLAVLVPRSLAERATIGCALAAVMTLNVAGVASGYASVNVRSIETYAPQIVSVLEQEHVRYGYASYWDALPLTLYSHGSLQVAAVSQCKLPVGTLCAFQINSAAAWYRTHPGSPSFVIVNPATLFVTVGPPGTGPWRELILVGPIKLYISPDDISAQIVGRPTVSTEPQTSP